ncbi:MAG: EAL domain-containing protein [Acidobacteriota bacterium]|nr:EAL domain-containing protein [Acidobacteriota bacterium]
MRLLAISPQDRRRDQLEESLVQSGLEYRWAPSFEHAEGLLSQDGDGWLVLPTGPVDDQMLEDLRQLRRRYSVGQCQILVAADAGRSQIEALLEAGADDFLPLPLNADQLALRARIARHRLRREALAGPTGAVRENDQGLRLVMEKLPSLLLATDREMRLISLLGGGVEALQLDAESMDGQKPIAGTLFDLFETDDPDYPPIRGIRQALGGESVQLEFEWLDQTFHTHIEPIRDAQREITGAMAVSLDITQHRRTEKALSLKDAYFQQLFENSPQAIIILDNQERIWTVNRGFEELFGYDAEDLRQSSLNNLIVPPGLQDEGRDLMATVLEDQIVHTETVRRHQDGRLIFVSLLAYPIRFEGKVIGVYGIYNDITERKRSEELLRYDALHDSLTGLPNRTMFKDRVQRSLEQARRQPGYLFAVLFLDLDHFKVINDSLGHGLGDKLLISIAERLKRTLRPGDTVARLGGDEFVVLLGEVRSLEDGLGVARRIQEELCTPFDLSGHEVFTGASIGVALGTSSYRHPEELIRDADIAMYEAKALGRGCHAVFDAEMHTQAMERLHLETDLRRAVERQEFCVHYQPLVRLDDGRIHAFEALVRWMHPERGLLPPRAFLSLAEETGLTVALSRQVLRQACAQLRDWQEEFPELTVSVNLSAKQFLQPDLGTQLDQVLEKADLDPAKLRLEITEGVILHNAQAAVDNLQGLKERHIQLYLDDFGTGYSSLSYLQNFPIDTLKIDRSFVSGGEDGEGNPEIVRTIVTLAHNLGLEVVAEGVETAEQLARLRELGCEWGQGYFFARPLDADLALELLRRNQRW